MFFFEKISAKKILAAIIIAGVLLRLLGALQPVVEIHTARQILDAMVARNFSENGYNILFPQINVLSETGKPIYYALEFHIMPFIASLFYGIFGVREIFGRLVSMAFFCLSCVSLFLLSKKFFGEKTALLSTAFFAFSPLNILMGRSFQPDEMMLFFAISSVYFFTQWIESGKKTHFTAAALFSSIAVLLKAPIAVYLVFPFVFLSLNAFGKKAFFKKSLWILAIVVIIPTILWQLWAEHLYLLNPHFWTSIRANAEVILTDPDSIISILDLRLYSTLLARLATEFLTPIGFAFFAIGLFALKKLNAFHAWIFGTMAFVLAFPGANYFHDYYQLGFVPAMAVFAAIGLEKFLQSGFFKNFQLKKGLAVLLILLFSISMIYYARAAYKPLIDVKTQMADNAILESGKLLESLTPKSAKIAVNEDNLALLYYGNRNGWTMGQLSGKKAIERIEKLKLLGAKYFSSTDIKKFSADKEFSEYLKKNCSIISEDENFILLEFN